MINKYSIEIHLSLWQQEQSYGQMKLSRSIKVTEIDLKFIFFDQGAYSVDYPMALFPMVSDVGNRKAFGVPLEFMQDYLTEQ